MRIGLLTAVGFWTLSFLPAESLASGVVGLSTQSEEAIVVAAAPRNATRRQARPANAGQGAARTGGRAAPKPQQTQQAQQTQTAGDAADGQELRRGEKVEFDARLIQGQTAKAGAVYLFERVSSDLSSMVQERRSYRREIVEEVFPQEYDR